MLTPKELQLIFDKVEEMVDKVRQEVKQEIEELRAEKTKPTRGSK